MLERVFGLSRAGSSVRREVLAGLTTFVTVAYIVVVNPAILEAAGIPRGPSTVATILTAVVGTLLMGLYANRPFAVAPYMGENAFVAYTVVGALGFSWQTALGAILVGGGLFIVLTLTRVRTALVDAIPKSLKYSFAVGIGLFLAFIGLHDIGVVREGMAGGPPVRPGDLSSAPVLVGVGTFVLMALLHLWRVPGAILIAILAGTGTAFATGVAPLPAAVVSAPPSIEPIFAKVDLGAALSLSFLNVALVIFIMDLVDTMGTLIGVSSRAGFLDADGNLPQIERPMLADAVATTVAPILGTTTAGAYIESAAGVEAGGRTGLVAVVTALLFLVCLFFSPLLTAVPPCAYGPALVFVGLLMVSAVVHVPFDRVEELVPAFAVLVLMSFTFNIGVGMTAGFLLYPPFMAAAGRVREV
jgi:AGZA family xanthine/uracil permease-like MFS transporter